MAFPTTSLLDNFNRANGGLGSAWTTLIGTAPAISSNQVQPNAGGAGPSSAYWNASTWADVEAWTTIAALSADVRVYARMTGANGNGYAVRSGSGVIDIRKITSGSSSVIAGPFTQAVAVGDAIGISVQGTTITAWYKPSGGSWTSIGSVTDSTYSAAGFIGLYVQNSGALADDFGGGAISTAVNFVLGSGGVGATTLALTAPTQVPLNPTGGQGSTSLALTAPTKVPLNPTGGIGATTLVLSTPARAVNVPLDPISGVGSTTLALTAPLAPGRPQIGLAVRETPPTWLAVVAQPPGSQSKYRWGGDEPAAADRFQQLQISSSVPGGFDTATANLARIPGRSYPDLERHTFLLVHGAGGRIAGEYRLKGAPDVSGDQMAISPAAVGYKDHLADDNAVSLIVIDRDYTHWAGAGAQRKVNLIGVGAPASDPDRSWDVSSRPAITLRFGTDTWASPMRPCGEMWYDAGAGNQIAAIRAEWAGENTTAYGLFAALATDSVASSYEQTSDLYTAGTGVFWFRPNSRRRFGFVDFIPDSTPGGTAGYIPAVNLMDLFVLGNHGLTLQGNGDINSGFLFSDIFKYVIDKWCPLVGYTSDSVQPTTYIIPHAVFLDLTNPAGIIDGTSRYGLEDWGVWDHRTAHLYKRGGYGRSWRSRVGEAKLRETGATDERMWNGVTVSYRDVDGTTRTVGPPGSGCDYTDPSLQNADPTNPANLEGVLRYAPPVQMNSAGTSGSAIVVGAHYLSEMQQLDRSGQADLVGIVEDTSGRLHPAWAVRGGDTISFIDAADPSPRRIVRASYSDENLTCSIDLDAPPDGMAASLARLDLAVIGVGS